MLYYFTHTCIHIKRVKDRERKIKQMKVKGWNVELNLQATGDFTTRDWDPLCSTDSTDPLTHTFQYTQTHTNLHTHMITQ